MMLGAGLMFFWWLLGAAAVLFLFVFLVRQAAHPSTYGSVTAQAPPALTATPAESPSGMLKRRYASGEIDREEYLNRLSDL